VPGVYISYPFCHQKCSFCNFASAVSPPQTRAHYEHALLAEIQSHRWAWLPDTIYFGGGTPSLMPLPVLRAVLDRIPRTNVSELTLECAPGTINRETAEAWRACGVNRISLGVQSFITKELRSTGRRHTAETVETDVETLRAARIDNINLDLIAGLPEQSPESWARSLDWIERLAPPHVSVYLFEIDEDSRLGKEVLLGGARYGANRVPSEDRAADLYERAVARLAAQGLMRYEISNFSRPGRESRHNLKYWRREPYAGFGLDAHSFDGTRRWSNPDTLPAYLKPSRDGDAADMDKVSVDSSEEHFFVGLRLMSGIEPTPGEWSRFAAPIERWLSSGMLEQDGARLRLSNRGVLLSNEVLQDFLPDQAAPKI
jgi:oxygen-independent coproporphyrinogen-3 oxidase